MIQHITAVYEDGVLKPLEPVQLSDAEIVTISIERASDAEEIGTGRDYVPLIAAEGDPNMSWEEVQALLAHLPGSLAEDFIRERDERF